MRITIDETYLRPEKHICFPQIPALNLFTYISIHDSKAVFTVI